MASIRNFQNLAWNRFWEKSIPNLFEHAGFTFRGVKVQYTPTNTADFIKRHNTHGVDDILETLKFEIQLTTSEATSLSTRICLKDVPFMQIPVFTQDGFVLKGTHWSLISDISPASGWYLGNSVQGPTLTLQKGSVPIIKLQYSLTARSMYLVATHESKSNTSTTKVKEKVPVMVFLKAMSPAMSYMSIAEYFDRMPIMMAELARGLDHEPTIEQCAVAVANSIGSTAEKYEDPIEMLHAYIYNNIVNIGPERKLRFENFMSFSKAIGTELAEPVKLGNSIIDSGTILTAGIIKRIEDAGVQEIQVSFKDSIYTLRKTAIEENVTFNEIICAVYNFCLFCNGLGKEDKVDNFCNKILSPVDATFEKAIVNELHSVSRAIRGSIQSIQSGTDEQGVHSMGNIEGVINNELLHRNLNADTLIQLIKKAPNSQSLEETNSLASLGQSYQVTRTSSTNNFPTAARDVQKSQYGRVCPYTTSESEKVGINLSLSTMTGIDEFGFLCTPYYKVVNGRRTDEIVDVNPIDERGKFIANVELNLEADGEPIDSVTSLVKINGDMVSVSVKDIDYQELSPMQVVGPLISMIPSVERNAGKRLIMGVKAQQQSIPTWRRERPWISTGAEAMMDIGVVRGKEIIQYALMQSDYPIDIPDDTRLFLMNINNSGNTCELEFESNHRLLKSRFSYTINRMNATMKGSPKHQRIALKERDETGSISYDMNDIVVYNNDISMQHMATSSDEVNFGKLSVPAKTIQEHALALGNNIKVLLKSWEGSGYEDSVIVNEDFVNRYGLTIITTRKIEYLLNDKERFGYNLVNANSVGYMGADGLPKLGTFLKAGQDIIGRKVETDSFGVKWPTIKLDPGQKGYVISASISSDGKHAKVIIGDILHLETGDKLAGLHGNKGVVGRIVPYHEMPFDENGEVPDIILNPLGVVSRNNLGQMVEGGLSLIGKETGVIQILPPFSGTKIEDIISRSEELGLVERDIYDGRTGRKFDKKGIIYIMHFLRLEHIATSKYNACSDGDNTTNQRTLQLNNSPGGGQRISELTTWCLNSYGADHLFDTLWTVQSDDLLGRQSLMDLVRQDMPTNTPIYQSNNLGLLEAYLRVLGINLVQDENGQRLEKLTSQQIMNLANGDCNLEYGDSSSEQSSYYMLRDPKIFGTWTMSKRDLIESRKIYGRLPLCCEMVMPIWLRSDSVTNLIIYMNDKGEVKPLSAQGSALMLLEKKLFISGWIEFDITDPQVRQYYNREAGISANYTLRIPRLEHSYVRVGKKDSRNPDPNNISEHTGIAGITELFMKFNVMDAAIYMDMQLINTWDQAAPVDILKDVLFNTGAASTDDEKQLAIAYITSTHKYKALFDNTVTDFMQLRNRVKAFAQSDCLVNFVVDAVIVPPIGYRPVYKETPATAMDLQLKSVVHTVKNLRRSVSGTNQYYDNMQSVFIALSEMIQAKPSEGKDSVNKTVLQELTQHQSKTSVLRDTLLSKRITHSGRSVISVDSKLKIGQAGIPLSIASKILEDHIIAEIRMNPERYSSIESLALGKFDRSPQVFKVYKKLLTYLSNNNIMGFVELSGLSSDVYVHFNDCKQELIQILTKIFKTMPVLLGREPSLHKFSIEGFQAIPVEGYAIKLHPLACHGFNADFDGDQMMVTFPIHGEGIKDVKTKMMMQDNLINPKDCELICAINQDMILGLYYATIFKNNAETLDVTDIRAYYNTQFFQDDEQFDGMKPKAFERLYEDVMLGTVHVQDTVLINHNGDAYCSTAGRILLNAMYSDMSGFLSYIEIDKSVKLTEQEAVYIKEYESRIALNRKDLTTGSTFSSDDSEEFRAAINRAALRVRGCIVHELLLDVTMMKDTVGKMSSLAIHYYGDLFSFGKDDLGDSLADFLNRIMNYGFWSADYSGITLSLYDFNRLPISAAVTATMPEVKETTSFIQQMYDEGMITEEERKSLNISEWNTLKRKLAGNIGSALKGSDNELDIKFDKMDNIYMIVASGSRGSTAQLMEISGIIGNVTNASNEVLETPITSNYMTGLSVSEAFNNSYTSRRQVMAAQLSTASAGEKTRKLIYMAENIHIRNSDTACSAKPTRIHLEYDVKLAFIEGARIQVEDTAPIPDEVYQEISEKLGKSVADIRTDYFEFSKHARESLETRLMDEDLKTLLKLTHFPFVIIQTASGYKPVFPAYKLTNKMRYMLLYRCINLDEFTDDAGYDIVREIQSCRLRVIPAAKYLGISAKEWRSRHDEWPAISEDVLDVIEYHQLDHVDIYTILGCEAPDGICMRCFGVKYDSVTFPDENEYIGYPAVQAIGEPTAQIVLDSHKSDDVGDGGSAISQLDQLLDKPGSICTAVVSSCDGEMQIRRDNGKIEIYVNGHKLGVAKNFDSLLVVPGTHVTTGTALTTGKVSYKEMSEHTDYKQVQVKFWRDFLDVFGNTKIMARNFEPIARSQSEFGVALETGGECTVGTLYPVQTLMENNVKYAPRILNQKTASNVRGKILTSISHSFFVQNATYHVVNHTKGLRESNIGRTLIGDLKTSPFTEPQGVIVPQPHKVFTQENQQKAAALLRMQRSVRSTRPSASKDAFTVDISGDTPVFTRVDELPQVNPVRSEVVIDFDEDIVEVGHEEKSNRFSK